MKRGEIWTVASGGSYAGKPRPAVIVQSELFAETQSVTICAFTTSPHDAPLLRLDVRPSARNGLRQASSLMVDKIVTVPRAKLGQRLGDLSDADMLRLARALVVFLGLAARSGPSSSDAEDGSNPAENAT